MFDPDFLHTNGITEGAGPPASPAKGSVPTQAELDAAHRWLMGPHGGRPVEGVGTTGGFPNWR